MPNAILFIVGMLMMACAITGWCCCYVGATNEPDEIRCAES